MGNLSSVHSPGTGIAASDEQIENLHTSQFEERGKFPVCMCNLISELNIKKAARYKLCKCIIDFIILKRTQNTRQYPVFFVGFEGLFAFNSIKACDEKRIMYGPFYWGESCDICNFSILLKTRFPLLLKPKAVIAMVLK